MNGLSKLGDPIGFWRTGGGKEPVFSACPRLVIDPDLPEKVGGLGNLVNGPVFSVPPSPTEDIGPLDGVSGIGAPGITGLGASGVTFLGTSTPDGFCPDFKLAISSSIVLMEDLYS